MLSIFQWFGYQELSTTESLRLIKQAGFEAVLLWWDDKFDPEYRKQPELARRAGLWVENIHLPFEQTNQVWEDTTAGQAVFEHYLGCVEDCATFGVSTMVMHPSFGFEDLPPLSEIGLERFRRIIDKAERSNIKVAMENMLRPQAIERAAWLFERIDSPQFGLCYDCGHDHARFSRTAETDLLGQFGQRLMALHLHDNNGTEDEHLLPFDGTINWPATMRKIAQTGYQGSTALELGGDTQGLAPEEFLAWAYEQAKKLEELRL